MSKLQQGYYGECPHCGGTIIVIKEGDDYIFRGKIGKKKDEKEEPEKKQKKKSGLFSDDEEDF